MKRERTPSVAAEVRWPRVRRLGRPQLKAVNNWREVPWSLWAFVVLMVSPLLVAVSTSSTPLAPSLFAVAFTFAWMFFLLRGLRWLWIVTTVLFAVFLVIGLAAESYTWYGDLLSVIQVALLLVPPTRQFFGAANPDMAA